MQKRWWLGFVSLIGVYKLPAIILAWHGREGPLELLSIGWFLWLVYFIPEGIGSGRDHGGSSR